MDRSLDRGVGLKASAKKAEVSLPQTGPFLAGMKKAAEQQAIPLLIDPKSARGSAKKNKAVGSDGCLSVHGSDLPFFHHALPWHGGRPQC